MLRLTFIVKLCILIALCSGCLTTNKYVGKNLHPNYYVCHCQTFPAYGYQTEKFFIYNYEVQKQVGKKYYLKGTAKFNPQEPGWKGLAGINRLELNFALIKDGTIVDSIRVVTSGDPTIELTFSKSFSPKTDFDGITVIGRYLHGWS